MGNSWRYAQNFQIPQSDLCECGHYRKDHNNMKGFCISCWGHGKLTDISQPPPDDVFDFLVGKREECEKFHQWSTEKVRAFWKVVNITLGFETKTEQTLLDDYCMIFKNHGYQ